MKASVIGAAGAGGADPRQHQKSFPPLDTAEDFYCTFLSTQTINTNQLYKITINIYKLE